MRAVGDVEADEGVAADAGVLEDLPGFVALGERVSGLAEQRWQWASLPLRGRGRLSPIPVYRYN